MQNTPFPRPSISSKPTALLLLRVGTVMNVNPCVPPPLGQQQQNLHLARPFRNVSDQRTGVSGKMTWFPVSATCLLTNGLASLHFNLFCYCEEAARPFSSQPILFWFLYSFHHGLEGFWCVKAVSVLTRNLCIKHSYICRHLHPGPHVWERWAQESVWFLWPLTPDLQVCAP